MPVQPSPAELLRIARGVAVEAGALAARRRDEGVVVAASKSSPEDIVTAADRECEALIRDLLRESRPHDAFLGEEGTEGAGSSGLTWIVDPIDGTVNYLYDRPQWAVSVAVVAGDPDPATWTALAGAVVSPRSNEVFTAARGEGAHLGIRRLAVNAPPLELALVGTGFAYSAEVRRRQADVVSRLIGEVRDIRRTGAASLDLCDLAAGRVDAYFERGLKPWDHAAGGLIATEAGAQVSDHTGGPATADLLIAAAPELWDRLTVVLTAADPAISDPSYWGSGNTG